MRLTRYLKPAQIRLELETATPEEVPEGWSRERFVWHVKERVLEELMGLFAASGKVGNVRKFSQDLLNRERKASTAIGGGIAIPHVRTMQAKDFVFCFARSTPGVEFGAPDGAPVHFFFGVVAPPHDDRLYLEVYREIARAFGNEETKEALAGARDEHELIRILSAFGE
jgi:mannitol/fructose-specific phosphotransferase system IIA component (Ntr-type)